MLRRSSGPLRLARRAFSSASTLVGVEVSALQGLMVAQGHASRDPAVREGLHPLVVPLASTAAGDVLGLLRWPPKSGEVSVVKTRAQGPGDVAADSLSLHPCGTPVQYARRAAVEADVAVDGTRDATTVISAAAEAAVEGGGDAYGAGDVEASRLSLEHFLLVRVGPFTDVWEGVARGKLAKGDETAALVAAERASSLNPGWGCCGYLQSQICGLLGRTEEQRDLALGALEAPFWTLGVPVADALAAAQLSHVDDLRGLVRAMEDKVREQQNAAPRTAAELAFLRLTDALDDVVRLHGRWDDSRPIVAGALREAGFEDAARIADVL